jgi:transposase-like protein
MNPSCRYCQQSTGQIKAGSNRCGSQRYKCLTCQRHYTPEPKAHGYPQETRQMALKLYLEGNNFRRIGRLLGVNHQSVVNWVNAYHKKLPLPQDISQQTTPVVELDELFTFIGDKKSASTS